MTARVLVISYMLLGILLIDFVWGSFWLSRGVELIVAVCAAAVWLTSVYILFRKLGLSLNQKSIGWFLVVTFVIYDVASTVASYYFWHDLWWRWITLDIAALLFLLSCIALLALLLRKPSNSTPTTPYTVESEAPDHVLHVSSTPNYSLKRTAADELR